MTDLKADDPRHGRRAGYIAGCRDTCCRDPHYRYQKRSRLRLLREGTQIITAAPTLRRVAWWDARGVSLNALCEAAGLGYGTLAELAAGERDVCLRSTARAIEAVTWDHLDDRALCYGDLTCIRIYSLMASGHPLAWISEQAGDGLPISGRWRKQERVRVSLARAVAKVSAAAPAAGPSRITAVKARNRGYHPIAAWDDPGVPAMPREWQPDTTAGQALVGSDAAKIDRLLAGEHLPATRAERLEVARRWVATGRSQNELERIHGWHLTRDKRLARANDNDGKAA